MGRRGGGRGGAYYREKYGRGRGRGRRDESTRSYSSSIDKPKVSSTIEELKQQLFRIDRKSYGAYHDIEHIDYLVNHLENVSFIFCLDRAQSDPFALPSKAHVVVNNQVAAFPPEAYSNKVRRIALSDFITRAFCAAVKKYNADVRTGGNGWHGAKGGDLLMDCPGQHVLERTSVIVDDGGNVEARFTIGLPAYGRSICGEWAIQIIGETIPRLVQAALLFANLPSQAMWDHILSIEDQEYLRHEIGRHGLIAFIRNGSVLPRSAGDKDTPLTDPGVVAFESPENLMIEFDLPHNGPIKGMGIPAGVTLFVGGGFHGKSTVLNALEVGVYNHIPGDGREFVVLDKNGVKIRAEDSRSVKNCDISPFINNLPFGRDTCSFSTQDASGSTSQAANIVEAIEVGAKVLLVDEDTCATNFMIRDRQMQQLVESAKEPITPFIQKVRSLHNNDGISSILVIGGAGEYFSVADTVVMMDEYTPHDVTEKAKNIATQSKAAGYGFINENSAAQPLQTKTRRIPIGRGFHCDGKISTKARTRIHFGNTDLNLDAVEQLVEVSQSRAIVDTIVMASSRFMDGNRSLQDVIECIEDEFDTHGIDAMNPKKKIGNYARPRKFEIAAAINRLRCGIINAEPPAKKMK